MAYPAASPSPADPFPDLPPHTMAEPAHGAVRAAAQLAFLCEIRSEARTETRSAPASAAVAALPRLKSAATASPRDN
ncbi:MAG TPA: hypothetical protein VHZ52_13840 [Acidobacteriaceae bacterium]|nr:hypothetical protein [Acidobacteriaceae bacterium]